MDNEKILVYSVLMAFVIGIVVVGYFTITSVKEPSGFSEVYFEEHVELPEIMTVNEEYPITFTVVSHEISQQDYTYLIKAGEEIIDEGGFSLFPEESREVTVMATPKRYRINKTLTSIKEWKDVYETEGNRSALASEAVIDASKVTNNTVIPMDIIAYIPPKFIAHGPQESYLFTPIPLDVEKNYTFRVEYSEFINNTVINKERITNINVGEGFLFIYDTIKEWEYGKQLFSVSVTPEGGEEYEIHFWYTPLLEGERILD